MKTKLYKTRHTKADFPAYMEERRRRAAFLRLDFSIDGTPRFSREWFRLLQEQGALILDVPAESWDWYWSKRVVGMRHLLLDVETQRFQLMARIGVITGGRIKLL